MESCASCTVARTHPKNSRFQCFKAGETVSWNLDDDHHFGTVCWTGFAGDKICSFVNFETPLPVPLKVSPSLEDLRDQFISSGIPLQQHSHLIPVEELSAVCPQRPLLPSHSKIIQNLKKFSKRMLRRRSNKNGDNGDNGDNSDNGP